MNNTEVIEDLQDFINQLREASRGKPLECVYVSYTNKKFEARAYNDDTVILEVEK